MDPWEAFFTEVEREDTTYDRIREKALGLLAVRDEHPAPVWMRYLDAQDRAEMLKEINQGLYALRHTSGDRDSLRGFQAVMHAWRVTGEQLADPLRRAVLLNESLPQESPE